jgi:hypothetical protein
MSRINVRVSNQLWRPGVPSGGTTGQWLKKSSSTSYDTEWFTVTASDIPIVDSGSIITATEVEGALAEHRALINTNSTHVAGDGSDHANVATNTTHSSGDGSDHADVATNTIHISSNGSDHTYIDQDVTSGSSPTFDNTNISGTVENTGSVSGAITIDLNDGDYHKLTATGDITSITISNTPTGSWGIIIEAVNWGAHTITLGSIEVPGGSITFTASGTDKLVLSGEGTNASLSTAQVNIS